MLQVKGHYIWASVHDPHYIIYTDAGVIWSLLAELLALLLGALKVLIVTCSTSTLSI